MKGVISTEKRGDKGWGFDPIFQQEGYTGTLAQLGEDVKNTFSHRRRALEKFKEYLVTAS
jgi:XTP/dITP diphosphohydrolase